MSASPAANEKDPLTVDGMLVVQMSDAAHPDRKFEPTTIEAEALKKFQKRDLFGRDTDGPRLPAELAADAEEGGTQGVCHCDGVDRPGCLSSLRVRHIVNQVNDSKRRMGTVSCRLPPGDGGREEAGCRSAGLCG